LRENHHGRIGRIGEHLVCADLMMQGHNASLAGEGMPFDVFAEIGGRLYRIQVKATIGTRPHTNKLCAGSLYSFSSQKVGKGGGKKYKDGTVDLFAMVALDRRIVAYIAPGAFTSTMQFRPRLPGQEFAWEEDNRLRVQMRLIKQASPTMLWKDVSARLNVPHSKVLYLNQKKRRAIVNRGKYMEDFTLERFLKESNA